MEKHFQLGEIDLDPFDGDERTTRGESWQGEGSGIAEQRSDAARGRRVADAETIEFQDGVPQARRATLPEVELLEVVPFFRGRTQSEPANFWIAVQYGRELRRMSDEFISTFTENKGLRISKSAGAIVSKIYRRMTNLLPGTGAPGSRQADDR